MEQRINERTFDRDIEDVRLFLSEEQPYCELIYDRMDKIYFLSHTIGNTLSGEETLLLSNVLLAQKNIRSDELTGMLENLLNITESSRRNQLYQFMELKLRHFKRERRNAILKMHWDLERSIFNCNQIELQYQLEDHEYVKRQVNPVELHIEGGYIYLIAYIIDKEHKSPAFYRLDRIHSFKIIGRQYAVTVRDKYFARDIHSNRYSMLAGEDISVTIKVESSMKKVVDDIFPVHSILDCTKDSCVFKISTYKQGFISWLLGQGKKVIIIEPEELREEVVSTMKDILMFYATKGLE